MAAETVFSLRVLDFMQQTINKITQCRKCKKQIVFLSGINSLIPVNAETVRPSDIFYDDTRHISHFTDCPYATYFSKQKTTGEPIANI